MQIIYGILDPVTPSSVGDQKPWGTGTTYYGGNVPGVTFIKPFSSTPAIFSNDISQYEVQAGAHNVTKDGVGKFKVCFLANPQTDLHDELIICFLAIGQY